MSDIVEQADQVNEVETGEKSTTYLMVTLPVKLKALLESAAEAQEKPTAAMAREIIAKALDYQLEPIFRGRAKKYASEEEKKAAVKAKADERRAFINKLMKLYASGKISDEMLAAVSESESDEE
jgi:hypothetical protein